MALYQEEVYIKPRIQQVLREISAERGSLDLTFLKDWPVGEGRLWLTRFKGVGPKTAAIVLLFSLGLPAFPVDTHIYRVTSMNCTLNHQVIHTCLS